MVEGKSTRVSQVTPETPGIPRAMVLTVYFALSPVTGLSCHRHLARSLLPQELDASVGASGPHDFAVRKQSALVKAPLASTASRPASVTIASRPSCRDGTGRVGKGDLPDGKSGKFFTRGLDTKIAGQPVGQITGPVGRVELFAKPVIFANNN